LTFFLFFVYIFSHDRRIGNNPSPPQSTERASSEGRTVTHLAGHGGDQSGYSHPFQHMLHQHSGGWSGQDSGGGGSGAVGGGAGPITGGVGTGSASSLTSSSSNEGMSSSGGIHQHGGGASTVVGTGNYHGEKYKYDRLNETDANADNRLDPNEQYIHPLAILVFC
jgi:hypothetical protein